MPFVLLYIMKYHLSFNAKGLHTFDKTRKSCFNQCEIKKICYMNTNVQLKINPVYISKLDSNDKLILSSKFVKIISREIKFKNGGISKVRIFSNGDFSQDIELARIEINNIFNLCKVNPFVKFWLISRNFNILYDYISNHTIPNNLNVMFSTPIKPNQFFIDFCNEHKIQMTKIVLTKKESNCDSSKNRKSCLKNKCDLCFTYSKDIRAFYVHGKDNKQKLRELMK
jgi:hypothetical protein